MKAPDDTIYKTPDGQRVRIVAPKQVNRGQVSPMVYDMLQARPLFVVARVRDGKRLYGYKRADLVPENP